MTEYLFQEYDYHAVQEHQKAKLKEEIERIPQKALLSESPNTLAQRISSKWTVNIPPPQKR